MSCSVTIYGRIKILRSQRSPFFIPLVVIIIGGILLLNNFFLIDADLTRFWPVIFILLGVQVLIRGDLAPSWQAQTFGITRGSVESASLEINSGEIDVRLKSLKRVGRLISGQYTARSRPRLNVRHNHATLVMQRGETWLFSLADWEVLLAQDIPWKLLMSAHLGELEADLRGLNIEQAHIATGIGNIQVICPDREAGPIYVRSTFGEVQVMIPPGVPAIIRTQTSPFSQVIAEDMKADTTGKFYATREYEPEHPAVQVTVAATFGNILLAVGE
jgi:hypothetical protein